MCLGYLNCSVLWFSRPAVLRLGGRTVLWVEHPSKAAPPYLPTVPLLSPLAFQAVLAKEKAAVARHTLQLWDKGVKNPKKNMQGGGGGPLGCPQED